MRRYRTEKIIGFVRKYYPLYGLNFCADYTGQKPSFIGDIITDFKIYKNRFNVDYKAIINISNKYAAYFLGFFWADGHLNKNGKTIELCVSEKTYNEIYKSFSYLGDWYIWYNKLNKSYHIKSEIQELYDFLTYYNYRKKSKSSKLPILNKMPEKLQKFWWRGFSDGDGCFMMGKRATFVLVGDRALTWEDSITYFNAKLNIKPVLRYIETKINTGSSRLELNSVSNVLKFGDFIYNTYHKDRIGIDYKYIKFLDICKYYLNTKKFRNIGADNMAKYYLSTNNLL